MKLVSLQYADDLCNIDYNHRQYCQINPKKHDAMIHFMGYKNYLRKRIMSGYDATIREK